jgi:hypothetical protein
MEVDSWISGPPPGDGAMRWVILLAVAALAATPIAGNFFSQLGKVADALGKRAAFAVIVVAIFSFLLSMSVSILVNFPEPVEHDEFSYVLAGETFAKGRLSNPRHPLWEFFETIHVLQDPTYQSKYPPGQGLALALGIITTGEPIVGVWFASAVACGALVWMLLAWLPPRWAVAGGFLAAMHPVMMQWSAAFWGGAVALAGGALVLGALRRLWETPKFADGIVLAIGALILANSRPYEGLLICIPIAIALLLWMFRRARKGEGGRVLKHVIAPCLLILVPGLLWMGYYNFRVTGHPLQTPYMRHDQLYNRTPHFFFGQLQPPKQFSNPQLARQHNQWEPQHWEKQQTFRGWLKEVGHKSYRLFRGFFQPLALMLPLLVLPLVLRRDRWMQLAAAMILLFAVGVFGVTWNVLLHYAAPVAPLAIALLMACMMELSQRGRTGKIALQILTALFLLSIWPAFDSIRISQTKGPQVARARMSNTTLAAYPGEKQLFVVRYLPGHLEWIEWVYNGADIDSQDIVWARDLGPEKLPRLLEYYKDRRKWIIEVGAVEIQRKPLGWKPE